MPAEAKGDDGRGGCRVKLESFELVAGRGNKDSIGSTKVTIRPERVRLESQHSTGENRIPAMVERWVYLGNAVQLIVRLATGSVIQVLIQNSGDDIPFTQGTPVQAHFPIEALRVLVDTEAAAAPK
jgi:ABC-type Fe3+/spermidine/putrescine transport system ATPase subunit